MGQISPHILGRFHFYEGWDVRGLFLVGGSWGDWGEGGGMQFFLNFFL